MNKPSSLLIVVGSKSDIVFLAEAKRLLRKSDINFEVAVISSHRNVKGLITRLDPMRLRKERVVVILAVAHSVANLPAIIAGYLRDAPIHVIGVGRVEKDADTIESLLSVISIPKGVPLLNAGIGNAGLYNAILAVIKILKAK